MTCSSCHDLVFPPEWIASGGHQSRMPKDFKEPFIEFEYGSIKTKARSCLSCALVRDVVDHYIPADLMQSMKMRLGYHHTLTLSTRFPNLPSGAPGWWNHPNSEIQIYKLEGTESPWQSVSDRDEVTGCTGDQVSLAWAKSAIEACGLDERCSPPVEAELPTRILDIDCHENEDEIKTVTLVEGGGKRAQYACLSHCWGDPRLITKTTTRMLAEHKRGITVAALPKTFQEAIIFTHRLGLRCILQDSPADWLAESRSMARVYSNCTVCLGATMSSSGTGGLFRSNTVPIMTLSSDSYRGLRAPLDQTASWKVFARPVIKHDAISEAGNIGGPWNEPMPGVAPLLTRAWVFQERILSPRFLQFLDKELMLECRSHVRCMCGCQRDRMLSVGFGKVKAELTKAACGETDIEVDTDAATTWRQAMGAYTELCITKETDRLPAIQGLADYLEKSRKGRYLEGIWEDCLFEELTWVVNRGIGQYPKRTNPLTAPTWSWGSVNARILPQSWFKNYWVQGECELLEVIQGERMMLVLSGRLSRAKIRYAIPSEYPEIELLFCGGALEMQKNARLGVDYDIWEPGQWHVPSDSEVFCLRLATIAMFGDGLDDPYHLVLRRVGPDVYERIGRLWQILSQGPEAEAPETVDTNVKIV